MRWLKRVGWGGGGFLILVLLWGLIEPYSIDERRETVTIPNLPARWEGRRVVVIADFRIGMWGANTATIYRIARRLAKDRPAAVVIAGDFVY